MCTGQVINKLVKWGKNSNQSNKQSVIKTERLNNRTNTSSLAQTRSETSQRQSELLDYLRCEGDCKQVSSLIGSRIAVTNLRIIHVMMFVVHGALCCVHSHGGFWSLQWKQMM